MSKKIPFTLTTWAFISITFFPMAGTATHSAKNLSLNLTNTASHTTKKLKNATTNNQSFCYYVTWAGTWWCLPVP